MALRFTMATNLRQIVRHSSLVVAVFFAAALATSYFVVQRTLPTVDGVERAAGLIASVEVLRDSWGVPHIYAENDHDVFFAQGYVTAQDRLWQMELYRRAGSGTLAEIVGKPALDSDRLMRTLGFRRVAEQEALMLDAQTRQMVDAYAEGVNAFVITHQDRLPLEFILLGFKPQPWTPVDSLIFGKILAWDLSGNWQLELLRASLVGRFGHDVMRELLPTYPADAPVVVPPGIDFRAFATFPGADLTSLAPLFSTGADLGSNNWVVDATRATTGAPLLANDPHLGVQMPALWYEVHLSVNKPQGQAGLDVTGASLPGVPGVLIGHNERIAWGETNLPADVQDLYVEKINPENPLQYMFRDRWQDMTVIDEQIAVHGEGEPVPIRVLQTVHGPLLNGVVKGLGQTLALRWTALIPGNTLRAFAELNRAGNWHQFRDALRDFVVPSQNFVYADVDGNIGYQAPGLVPVRARGDGLLPVPGWTGQYEWASFVPFDQLPSAYNPPEHSLYSANNRVADDRYPNFLSYDWNPGYRARRIEDLLENTGKLDVPAFQRMQNDVKSLPLLQLAGALSKLQSTDANVVRALRYVENWNGNLDTTSVAGTILEVTLAKLMANVYEGPMGPELFKTYSDTEGAIPSVLTSISGKPSLWFSSVRTSGQPSATEVLLQSLKDAIADLRRQFGDDMAGWHWGKLHTVTFAHPLGEIKPLDHAFNLGSYAAAGSRNTVDQTAYTPSKGFAVSKLPSLRMIIDLGDFDRSSFVATTGQSGQPFSRHFGDQVGLWLRGEYHPMLFSRRAVQSHLEGRLLLTP